MRTVPFASDYHAPVLCHTVLKYLVTDPNGMYVDATAGGGGHVSAILSTLSNRGRIVAVDCDTDAVEAVKKRLPNAVASNQLMVLKGRFGNLQNLLQEFLPVTGLLLDLGVSSHQLDTGSRGFSHRHSARLDMRMDIESRITAYDIVNSCTEDRLTDLLRSRGEEPRARRICRAILANRPVQTTRELARIVRSAVPVQWESRAVTRTFQALRITVNEELEELARVLTSSSHIVEEGGRIVVISYHSLEDRMVKRMLRDGVLEGETKRDFYGTRLTPWKPLTRRPVLPDPAETSVNRRARSAKLRAAVRCPISVQT